MKKDIKVIVYGFLAHATVVTALPTTPVLANGKCRKREYIEKSRSYKFYQSGELIKHREDDREYMG